MKTKISNYVTTKSTVVNKQLWTKIPKKLQTKISGGAAVSVTGTITTDTLGQLSSVKPLPDRVYVKVG